MYLSFQGSSDHSLRLKTLRTMGNAMKTHFILTGAVVMMGTTLLTTSFAYEASEYLIFTRHRDSNGHLLAGPTHHQSQPRAHRR